MTPSPSPAATVGDDQNLELRIQRHMGCMAGFLHHFDRPHIFAGKNRLPTFPAGRSEASVPSSHSPPSPEATPESCAAPARPSVTDGVRSSWKLREAPRFSLDSRAIVDAKGKLRPRSGTGGDQRRSPSVVARLMGLDALPDHGAGDSAMLRRSASESRVPRDRTLFRFVDSTSFQSPWIPEPKAASAPSPRASPLQRKSFDFFPEQRLRARGIDEPVNNDLEALKQILEALQLKGLLHSKLQQHQSNGVRDFPVVSMKSPSKRPPSSCKPSALACRRISPERQATMRSPRGRKPMSPDRAMSSKTPNMPARRRQSNAGNSPPIRRGSSPRTSPKRIARDSPGFNSLKNWKAMPVEDDTSTTNPDSSISYSSQYELERSPVEYRSDRSVLQRCDKLRNSMAAITSLPADHTVATPEQQQPSPVSVLEASSFLGGDELPSPSPATKLSLDFYGTHKPLGEREEVDHWNQQPEAVSDHAGDLAYISEILRLSERLRDPSVVYALLEKRHQWDVNRPDKASRVHRRLVFDAVAEILDLKRSLPPWEAATLAYSGSVGLLREVWEEVRRLRVAPAPGDLNEVTRGAIRKDMVAAGDQAWRGACGAEMSDAVLYIERQVFKDLVGETICELAGGEPRSSLPRRRLVFRDPLVVS